MHKQVKTLERDIFRNFIFFNLTNNEFWCGVCAGWYCGEQEEQQGSEGLQVQGQGQDPGQGAGEPYQVGPT